MDDCKSVKIRIFEKRIDQFKQNRYFEVIKREYTQNLTEEEKEKFHGPNSTNL